MDAPAPWFRVPVLFAAPTLLLALVVLAWYARGLLRTEASRVIRALRLCSLGIAALVCIAMFLGLSVFDPDSTSKSERVSFLIAWVAVGIGVMAAVLLAIAEFVFISRRSVHEFRAMHREAFGGQRKEAKP